MAEIVGFTASIAGLIQFTGKAASAGYGYLGKVKRAPDELHELVEELNSLQLVLTTLQEYTNTNPQSTALQKLNSPSPDGPGPLRECARELRLLLSRMEPKAGWRKLVGRLKWPLQEAETLQIIARFERLKGLFSMALSVDHISVSKKIERNTQHTDIVVQSLQKTDIEEKRKKVLNWVYSGSCDAKHLEITNRRGKNTGGWILRSPEFKEWISDPGSRPLWGHGIPGAGKTFLCSVAIDHLEEQASAANYGVAHVYLDYKEQDQQKPIAILASLVKQLASQIPTLPAKLQTLYDFLEPKGKKAAFEDLYTALLATTKPFSQVYLVFDALDECDQDKQRKVLLPLFSRMAKDGIKLFVTSRPHPEDIQESFKETAKVKLLAKEEDIESYIQQKIDENPKAKRLVRQGKCEGRIISELIDCAKGMFLLVRFHIEYICQQTTSNQILAALDQLKCSSTEIRPLDPTYDRAMENIRGQPKTCTGLAFKVLMWIVKARRPLTVSDLQVAVSVETHQRGLSQLDLPDEKTLVDVCASLVMIDETSSIRTVRLAHYTVQEYLLAKSLIPEDADLKIITACTSYLTFDIFHKERSVYPMDPLVRYIVGNLIAHLNACDKTLTADLILNFVKGQGRSYCARLYIHYVFLESSSSSVEISPLHLASILGHSVVVRKLLDEIKDSPARNGFIEDRALRYAARNGHEEIVRLLLDRVTGALVDRKGELLFAGVRGGESEIVRLLLDKGANISVQDKEGQTVLLLAAVLDKEASLRLLLENGADTSVQDKEGRTALHWAARNGSKVVCQLLLENGADISAQDKEGRTALHLAAGWDKETSCQLLLENGADISVQDKEGRTALHWAARVGSEEMCQLLLGNGADTLIQDKEGRTALHWAARNGSKVVCQLLLENGADISAQDKEGQTALHLAAVLDKEASLRLLLENGADTSVQDKEGRTALHRTARNGSKVVCQLLLENGADTSVQDKEGRTALHLAAVWDNEALCQLLLENGADTSVQDMEGRTALHLVAERGNEAVCWLLLENGADTSVQDNEGQIALHLAVGQGSEAVCLLLFGNIDISVQDKKGRTALHIAACQYQEAACLLLLENGANTSVQDKEGRTALHLAAEWDNEIACQLLLVNGADTSVQDNEGQTALHLAARNECKAVCHLLENVLSCSR